MEITTLQHNGLVFKFRTLVEDDLKWMGTRFAEPGRPDGIVNFQRDISDFNDHPRLAQALFVFMHKLLVDSPYKDVQSFIDAFGSEYSSTAVLFHQFSENFDISTRDVTQARKIIKHNKRLKSDNQKLRTQLMLEKAKTLSNLIYTRA